MRNIPSRPHCPQPHVKKLFHPFGKGCFKSPKKVTSPFPEEFTEQSLPETALFLGSLALCRDSKYMANGAICQCLCLDKQSVSILVYGFCWDQLCLLSPLNGRAVCKHPGIKPSGARSGPSAALPVACVRHPLAPRWGTTAGLVTPVPLSAQQPAPSCPCHQSPLPL